MGVHPLFIRHLDNSSAERGRTPGGQSGQILKNRDVLCRKTAQKPEDKGAFFQIFWSVFAMYSWFAGWREPGGYDGEARS
jgi:hypothetical protein